ncbi:MAG: cupin domain-containing protein [Pseudomonadota bacterium]
MAKIKVTKPTSAELEKMNVTSWGTWGCEVSVFDWTYDNTETCYILDGRVIVKTDEGETEIKAGDLVTFSKDLSCTWDVKKAIRKHFRFGD